MTTLHTIQALALTPQDPSSCATAQGPRTRVDPMLPPAVPPPPARLHTRPTGGRATRPDAVRLREAARSLLDIRKTYSNNLALAELFNESTLTVEAYLLTAQCDAAHLARSHGFSTVGALLVAVEAACAQAQHSGWVRHHDLHVLDAPADAAPTTTHTSGVEGEESSG